MLDDGDHDWDDDEHQPVVSSTRQCDGAGCGRSMLAFRYFQQSNHCARDDFLYDLKRRPCARRASAPCAGAGQAGAVARGARPHPPGGAAHRRIGLT
jgi:hypothetical protein